MTFFLALILPMLEVNSVLILSWLPGVWLYSAKGEGLTEFPSDIPATSTKIDLEKNNIASIPSDAFDGFDNLEHLNLYDNDLTAVPDLSAVQDTLIELDLGKNPSFTLSPYTFANFSKLEKLLFAKAGVQNPVDLFIPEMLQKIDFWKCNVRFLTLRPAGSTSNLKTIDLHLNTNLKSVDITEVAATIETIDFYNIDFTRIPDELLEGRCFHISEFLLYQVM